MFEKWKEFLTLGQFWFERRTILIIAVLLGVFFYSAAVSTAEQSPITAAALSISFGMAAVLLWWLFRLLYWKLGRRIKIGIAYESFEVPLAHWLKLVESFYELFQDSQIRRYVSLRKIPSRLVRTPQRANKFVGRFKFTAIVVCTHSENKSAAHESSWRFATTVPTDQFDADDIDVFFRNVPIFRSGERRNASTLEQLQQYAQNEYELLLFLVGRRALQINLYDISLALLVELDRRCAARRIPPTSNPRIDIRFWISQIRARKSFYSNLSPPAAEALEQTISECEEAITEFGEHYPYLKNAQARNLFFANRLNDAQRITKEVLASPAQLPKLAKSSALLNYAVLNLLLNDFREAESSFRDFLKESSVGEYGQQLVEFADFAFDYGYEPAIFLRVKYREALGLSVDSDIRDSFVAWQLKHAVPRSLVQLKFS